MEEPALPPTEQVNPRTRDIDRPELATVDVLAQINGEDAAVAGAVALAIPALAPLVDAVVGGIRAGGGVIYAGAGTSGRIAITDASEMPPTYNVPPTLFQAFMAGGDAAVRRSVEGAEDDDAQGRRDFAAAWHTPHHVVIALSANGGARYLEGVLREAQAAGCTTALITANPRPRIAQALALNHVVIIDTGPEAIQGSTRMKAGTAQKLALNMISTAAMVRLGYTYGNRMVNMQGASNEKLKARAVRVTWEVLCSVQPERPAFYEADPAVQQVARHVAACHYDVKTAVLSLLQNISPEEAAARLAAAGHSLKAAVGKGPH